jgi:SAM-dependent methyltransferase
MSTSDVFGSVYANHYDLFYRHKDYAAECDFLETIFERFASAPIHSVLDLGCGTGDHALPLAERGYAVTGVDRSQEMLTMARSKAAESASTSGDRSLVFHHADIRKLELGKTFDAVIMMFAVLGYQTANDDLAAALAAVRRHLVSGGLFVADFWYGPAVLAQRPGDRVREWSENGDRVFRLTHSELDVTQHTVYVRFRVEHLRGTQVIAEAEEEHPVRFFFPQELAYFAAQAGLEQIHLCPFLNLDGHADETSWNVSVVMRATSPS